MKYILKLLIIITAYFSSSQVRITQKNVDGILVQDDFYLEAEMNIKFSKNMDTLIMSQKGFQPNTNHTFPIINICLNKKEIIITSFLFEDAPEKIVLIKVNTKLNSIQFDLGKGIKKFEGNGINITFLNENKLLKLDICREKKTKTKSIFD